MKINSKPRKYNLCTLKPKAKEDQQEFWKFRAEDVAELFILYVFLGILMWILQLIYCLVRPTEINDTLQQIFVWTI